MINNIKKEFYEKYYNIDKFKESNEIFEKYLDTCDINKKEMKFTDFNISTITCIVKIANYINIKVLFEQLEVSNDIIYLEYNEIIKGKREKKKIKKKEIKDKRMEKKGKSFSNQLSIGFNCDKHYHKKPICMKIFSKGSLTITGVKSNEEINYVIHKFISLIDNIKNDYFYNNKIIKLYPYKELKRENIEKSIETINGSFKCEFNVNLKNLKKCILNKYQNDELYLKNNRSALIELDLVFLKTNSNRKNKEKIPKVSVYGTGSIVINSVSEKILYKSYEFIKKFITENYDYVIDKDYEFNL